MERGQAGGVDGLQGRYHEEYEDRRGDLNLLVCELARGWEGQERVPGIGRKDGHGGGHREGSETEGEGAGASMNSSRE